MVTIRHVHIIVSQMLFRLPLPEECPYLYLIVKLYSFILTRNGFIFYVSLVLGVCIHGRRKSIFIPPHWVIFTHIHLKYPYQCLLMGDIHPYQPVLTDARSLTSPPSLWGIVTLAMMISCTETVT